MNDHQRLDAYGLVVSVFQPNFGFSSFCPIPVSGNPGVLSYLRRLVRDGYSNDCGLNAQGLWPEQRLILGATRICILSESTPGLYMAGDFASGQLLVCRVRFISGELERVYRNLDMPFVAQEIDLFFQVVDGAVEQPCALQGWQLSATECNPGLMLLDHPRFVEGPQRVRLSEHHNPVHRVRWKDEVSVVSLSPLPPVLDTNGYWAGFPIKVSGDYGVLSYLRRLVLNEFKPDAEGRWPKQSLILSATRLAILEETTSTFNHFPNGHMYWNEGGRLLACRLQFRGGEADVYFKVVECEVKWSETLPGWQLMSTECNPGLELVDHPRLREGRQSLELVQKYGNQQLIWNDELVEVEAIVEAPPPLTLSIPANQDSASVRRDAIYGYSFAPTPLSANERATRADLHPPTRKYALIGGQEIEVVAGSILWDSARVPLESISGLCWKWHQKGSGWIRLRAGDLLFEANWDDAEQPSGGTNARKLVGILLSEIRQPIVDLIRNRLLGGACEPIGVALLERDGIRWTARGFFGPKTLLCTWGEVQTEIDNAAVLIKVTGRRFEPIRVGLDVENAFALHFLPARMLSN